MTGTDFSSFETTGAACKTKGVFTPLWLQVVNDLRLKACKGLADLPANDVGEMTNPRAARNVIISTIPIVELKRYVIVAKKCPGTTTVCTVYHGTLYLDMMKVGTMIQLTNATIISPS